MPKTLPTRLGSLFATLFGIVAIYFFVDALFCQAEWMCGLVVALLATPWWMFVEVTLQTNLSFLAGGLLLNTMVTYGVGYLIGVIVNKIKK